ncbi:hypothetical protein AURDEDRAFT_182241 [Auricularia subglabra TFB-10046 SS5]|nr:hypothetical protein AURDEDRAFT_182241 [Auricularia subglabra TFB-10046 SS5]
MAQSTTCPMLEVTDDARLMSDVASRAAFNVISMGPTLLGLPMFLVAILFGKGVAKRGAIFLNFIIAVLVMGLSFGLLPLVGEQDQLHPRSRMLCFVQAALVDGALAMTPVSILSLVLQLGMGLCLFDSPDELHAHFRTVFDIVLIALPYLSFLVFGLRDVLEFSRVVMAPPGSLDIDIVNAAFYCTIASARPFVPIAPSETPLILFMVGVSSATLLVECYIAFMLWRRWSSLRAAGNEGVTAIIIRSLVRLTLLTLYRVVIIGIAISVVEEPRIFTVAAFLHGAIPMSVFLIFALQQLAPPFTNLVSTLFMLHALLFVSAAAAANILFVGDSFTYGNSDPVLSYNKDAITDANGTGYGGVPGIFKKLVGSSYNVTIEAVTGLDGSTLEYHFENHAAVLADPKWDVVVLQEAGNIPLPPTHGDRALFVQGVTGIADLVRKNAGEDTKIWLFETWATPAQVYPDDEIYHNVPNGLAAMQSDLHEPNFVVAEGENLAGVVAVGDAFLAAVDTGVADANPYDGIPAGSINLWADDNDHASKYGSYLAAVSFFSTITGGDPNSLPTGKGSAADDLGISEEDAKRLHAIAA